MKTLTINPPSEKQKLFLKAATKHIEVEVNLGQYEPRRNYWLLDMPVFES